MKIGSLFDGSGGFPLAATMCGMEPVWASEVEPFPIAVTRSRFPNMKHLGSVTDVKGAEVEPVEVISFGSPCQDLSVAGKRAGLKHTENGDEETTRSGLFMEAVRIIKEMREATNGVYPRFAVWENVPGAFSSNKGEDFRIVLEELIKIVEPTAVMPAVPKNGWAYADVYCGDGWSLAYRVLDAQYWGVPQRRRRIYLVADFRGQRAGKVSFEREGLRGYFAKSRTSGEAVAGDAESGSGAANRGGVIPYTLKIRSGCKGGGNQTYLSATLATNNDQYLFMPMAFAQNQRDEVRDLGDKAGALQAEPGMKQQTFLVQPVTLESGIAARDGSPIYEGVCGTLRANAGDNQMAVAYKKQHLFENHSQDARYKGPLDVCPMLPAQLGTGGNNQPFVVEGSPVYCLQGNGIDRADTAGCNGREWNDETCYTLNTIDRPAVVCAEPDQKKPGDMFVVGKGDVAGMNCRNFKENAELYPTLQAKPNGGQSLNFSHAVCVRYIVRRLTPTECARLQGFPDNWAHPGQKNELTEEEYAFWLNVRNTHAEINGKVTKEYTRDQMLTWYNKLHTDSAEYKLWGNGIALPCALYVMEGIAEVLHESRN